MTTIIQIIFLIMLSEIVKAIYFLLFKSAKKLNDSIQIVFIESIKYYSKLFHLVGLWTFFVLFFSSSEFILDNILILSLLFLIVSLLWFFIYLSKILIITEDGIGYTKIFNYIVSFTNWDDLEFLHIERVKVVLYLKTKEKRKYSISLTNDELIEVQKYIPDNMNKYVYTK